MDGKQGRNIGVDSPDLGHRSVSDIQRIKLSAKYKSPKMWDGSQKGENPSALGKNKI